MAWRQTGYKPLFEPIMAYVEGPTTVPNVNYVREISRFNSLKLIDAYLCNLTHCGLVTPYGDKDLDQHWLMLWLVAW